MTVSVEWEVKATELANCNCAYGCPCQFNALPTHGFCRRWRFPSRTGAFWRRSAGRTAHGAHGALARTHPSGQRHHTAHRRRAGRRQQRDALLKIMSGKETDDMATMWWVYSAMSPNKPEPLFKPIEFDVDVESGRGSFRVPGVVETTGEPIRNPVTGAEHRVRIDLPQASSTVRRDGECQLKGHRRGQARWSLRIAGPSSRTHLSNKGRLN